MHGTPKTPHKCTQRGTRLISFHSIPCRLVAQNSVSGVVREEPLQTGFSAQTPGLGGPGGVGVLGAPPSLLVWSLSSSPCWPQPSPPSSWGRGQWLSGQRGAPPAALIPSGRELPSVTVHRICQQEPPQRTDNGALCTSAEKGQKFQHFSGYIWDPQPPQGILEITRHTRHLQRLNYLANIKKIRECII